MRSAAAIGSVLGIIFAFVSKIADNVEKRLKDRFDTIEDKLKTLEYSLSPRKDILKRID